MKPSLLVFNPHGDMDLILRQSRAQRTQETTHGSSSSNGTNEEPSGYTTAMEDQVEPEQGRPVKFKNISSSIQTVEDLRNLGSRNELGQHIELRYRVSSAHLALASPVFKAMVDKSCATIDMSSRSKSGFSRYAEALIILLDVIHGHHKSVPKAMSLELLIELWGLIDSHKCHEAVEMFSDHWVASVIDKGKIKGSSLKINMSRLYISWVFAKGEYFDLLVYDILESTAGPIKTNLPLPAKILGPLEHRREAIVNKVLDHIYELLEELWSAQYHGVSSFGVFFAPKGDTDLILRKPNFGSHQKSLPQVADPNAGAEENDEHAEQGLQDDQNEPQLPVVEEFIDVTASMASLSDLKNLKPSNEDGRNVELRYRVSSAHLMLASPVFRAMLDGPFKESSRNEDGCFEVKTSECSAQGLLILLDIIHGHHRDVPKTIAFSLLTEMAILVDYYQCHEIVEMFAENWIAAVVQEDKIEGSDSQTNISRLFISWVFGKIELFNSVVYSLIKFTARPIQTDLPLPSTILDSLEERRQSSTNRVLDNLYELLDSFWSKDGSCGKECTAIMLGTLIKQMLRFGLKVPRPMGGPPAQEKTLLELQEFAAQLESPTWRHYRGTFPKHCCWFSTRTEPWLETLCKVDICHGVRFEDFKLGTSVRKDVTP
ncbi:hypothetical protein FPANT_5825 [Fusarium pseudoanthophilum]|uniref:BTB domain-containing protein n=1 Tax=Fusarium pseudoanthophilum TaxID=48495 RepID=A0A8H5UII0_9HYPO|nr:hypothetical protein FPANT_5825 [Fusarium pseudoanthophilum]